MRINVNEIDGSKVKMNIHLLGEKIILTEINGIKNQNITHRNIYKMDDERLVAQFSPRLIAFKGKFLLAQSNLLKLSNRRAVRAIHR